MELRHYFALLRRAWWLVLGVPLLVLLISLPGFGPDAQRFRARLQLVVSENDPAAALPPSGQPGTDTYDSWQSSQYIIDDLPVIIRSRAFAAAVAATLPASTPMDAGAIQGSYAIETEHRILTVIIDAPSADAALAIATGTTQIIQQQGLRLWNRESPGGLAVAVLDQPSAAEPLSRWPQPVTRLALRVILGLLAGVGLAFLRHYLDRTIREPQDLSQLELALLATIPKE